MDLSLKEEDKETSFYKKGSIIFLENEASTSLYIIKSGRVRIVKEAGERIVPIAIIGQKEFLGETALFDDKSRSATAIAHEDVFLVKINKDEIKEQLKKLPEWVGNLMTTITGRLRETGQIMKDHKIIDDELSGGEEMTHEEEVKIKKSILEARANHKEIRP